MPKSDLFLYIEVAVRTHCLHEKLTLTGYKNDNRAYEYAWRGVRRKSTGREIDCGQVVITRASVTKQCKKLSCRRHTARRSVVENFSKSLKMTQSRCIGRV